MTQKDVELITKILTIAAKYDAIGCLGWNEDLKFYVVCNDLFYWGCADEEDLTEENLPEFERALKDTNGINADSLFCARIRKMRPQGAYYKFIKPEHRHLFDECGPERQTDFGNPVSQYA